MKLTSLRENFIQSIKSFPFSSAKEAAAMGVTDNPVIQPPGESTALETPYSFRKATPLAKIEKHTQTYEEEYSSYESSDENEAPFYGDEIKLTMDLFVHNKLIVENSEVTLTRNKKYGLVGRNGIGKSTLLKAIRRREFGMPKGLKIHMLRQDYVSDERVIDYVGADAGKILQSLGFNKERMEATIRSLSGGWRMRAQLARALHINPELLLLDEPTNFLDMQAIGFLEKQMATLKTVIVVSHDRNFLENTVDWILHLSDCRVRAYKGAYGQFVKQLAEERETHQREYDSVKAQREHIQSFIDRFRYNAKRSSQAQSRIKLLEKLPKVEPPREEARMKFRFSSITAERKEPKGPLVEFEHVKFSYGDKQIFRDLTFTVGPKARIVLVGENGTGKSTFLRMLTSSGVGQSDATSKITTNPLLRVGYFAQHHVEHLNHSTGALALLLKSHDEETSRAALSSFGLHVNNQKISTLSGGQKSKLAFAMISLLNPNLLVLDEPTNHLDMETIDALAEALIEFEGAVVCVSHDLAFVERVFKDVYVCEGGDLTYFRGTPSDYKAKLSD